MNASRCFLWDLGDTRYILSVDAASRTQSAEVIDPRTRGRLCVRVFLESCRSNYTVRRSVCARTVLPLKYVDINR